MRRIAHVLVVGAVAAVAACGPGYMPPGQACTTLFAYGLTVTVTSLDDGSRICDADVEAVDDDHRETLQPQGEGDDCVYVGAGERPGTYTITATKDGYASDTAEDVVVESDAEGCHVVGEQVELQLTGLDG